MPGKKCKNFPVTPIHLPGKCTLNVIRHARKSRHLNMTRFCCSVRLNAFLAYARKLPVSPRYARESETAPLRLNRHQKGAGEEGSEAPRAGVICSLVDRVAYQWIIISTTISGWRSSKAESWSGYGGEAVSESCCSKAQPVAPASYQSVGS